MPTRKKSPAGKVIKISQEVYTHLRKSSGGYKISFDATLRRLCGLPTRSGSLQKLKHLWVLRRPNFAIFETLKRAKGESIVRSVSLGQKREKPMKMREVK